LISAHEWKQKKDDRNISFVSERDKDLLWALVTAHFNLLAGEDLRKLGSQEDGHIIPDLEEEVVL